MNALIEATLAARKAVPFIGTQVKAGLFTIVRTIPKGNKGDCEVVKIAGPMKGWEAVDALNQIAKG